MAYCFTCAGPKCLKNAELSSIKYSPWNTALNLFLPFGFRLLLCIALSLMVRVSSLITGKLCLLFCSSAVGTSAEQLRLRLASTTSSPSPKCTSVKLCLRLCLRPIVGDVSLLLIRTSASVTSGFGHSLVQNSMGS